MDDQGVEMLTVDTAVLAQALAADTQEWGDVIRRTNIRLE